MTGRKKSGARKRRTLLGESVGLVYTFLRRRLIRPRPARAAPKIARLAGSGTTAALLNRRKLSGPSSAFRIVVSRAIVVQLLPVPTLPPHAVLIAAASAAVMSRAKPTPPLPRFTPVSANTRGLRLSTEVIRVPDELKNLIVISSIVVPGLDPVSDGL